MAVIYKSIQNYLENPFNRNTMLICTSGGFDPLHVGHLRCIQESKYLAKGFYNSKLMVIVNGDGFLIRKKGFVFMPLEERMEIIAGIEGVDVVVPWDDGTQFVTEALRLLKPKRFTKGGDRSEKANVPEFDLCQSIGCEVVFGVGGREKIQSSTNLIERVKEV